MERRGWWRRRTEDGERHLRIVDAARRGAAGVDGEGQGRAKERDGEKGVQVDVRAERHEAPVKEVKKDQLDVRKREKATGIGTNEKSSKVRRTTAEAQRTGVAGLAPRME